MEATHKITIDMVRKGVSPRVYAMQFDTNTRAVLVTMLSNGEPWEPPAGAAISLSYKKPDGTAGFYNRLSDDNSAVSVDGNIVTVVLAHQVLTVPGKVDAALVVNSGQLRLATFPFEIHVTPDPSAGKTDSDDYFNPGIVAGNAVLYVPQELDEDQKAQARANIGAAAAPVPIAYLYNGIQLPPLPAYDRAKYPYAAICTYKEGNAFGAIFPASAVLYLYTAHPEAPEGAAYSDELWLPQIGDLTYTIEAETTQGLLEFTDWGSPTTITERKGPYITSIKWANFDLYYQTDIYGKKGQLYLAATEPVPVYPENGNGSAEVVGAVLYTPQTLTPEQQEQARKNIGAEVSVPVMLNLTDYGIDYASLLLAGGGTTLYEDVGSLWEDVNGIKPGQSLLLSSSFGGDVLVVPSPATLYFQTDTSGTTVMSILATLTFYYDSKLLTASSYLVPYGTSGAAISVEVTSMGDIEAALDSILAIQNELIGGDSA